MKATQRYNIEKAKGITEELIRLSSLGELTMKENLSKCYRLLTLLKDTLNEQPQDSQS